MYKLGILVVVAKIIEYFKFIINEIFCIDAGKSKVPPKKTGSI